MSAPEGPFTFNVSIDDVQNYDWQSLVARSPGNLFALVDTLGLVIREAQAAGDERGVRVYRFIHAVASFMPNFDLKTNVFQPMMSNGNGQRTPIGEDLVDGDLVTLRGMLDSGIQDPTFRARVGDVLWECKKDAAAARTAIAAYREAADAAAEWTLGGDSLADLQRALQLSARLGFGQPLHVEVIESVRAKLATAAGDIATGVRLLPRALMDMLLALSKVAPAEYATLAQTLGEQCRALGDRRAASSYFDVASQWYRRAKNEAEAMRFHREAAEDLAAVAEEGASKGEPGYGQAEHYLQESIHLLRAAHGEPERIDQLIRRLIEIQKLAAESAQTMELRFSDIPGFDDTTAKASAAAAVFVQGVNFEEAIERLVGIAEVTNVDELREQYAKAAQNSPFMSIIAAAAINSTGQTTGRLEPALRAGVADESTL